MENLQEKKERFVGVRMWKESRNRDETREKIGKTGKHLKPRRKHLPKQQKA